IKFMDDGFVVIADPPKGKAGIPARLERTVLHGKYYDCNPPKPYAGWPHSDTEALWMDFLKCVRNRDRNTLSPPELGAAAFTTVNMGVQSYRFGRVLFWDKKEGKVATANDSWAKKWEQRSHKREEPFNILGWKGGMKGCHLNPPEYMKL